MSANQTAPVNIVDLTQARIARAIVLPRWTSLPPYVIYDTGPRYVPGSGEVIFLPARKAR